MFDQKNEMGNLESHLIKLRELLIECDLSVEHYDLTYRNLETLAALVNQKRIEAISNTHSQ